MKKKLPTINGFEHTRLSAVRNLFDRRSLKAAMLLMCLFLASAWNLARAQSTKVSGQVTDEENKPVQGVTVTIKNSTTSTAADAKGFYSITVPDSRSILVFSSIGYSITEIPVNGKSVINVTLSLEHKSLSEVVVVGYGTQSKRNVTGAVSTIKAAELDQTNAVSIDNLIQGKASGVNVSTYTSQPGGGVNVTIRGALSPNGSNAPLYVIDGLPLTELPYESVPTPGGFRGNIDRSPLAGINPDDIASIDILKDASATAIYGSAAANGVILITTKKGRDGSPTVNYNGTYSLQTLKSFLQPLNATQFENAVDQYGQEYYKFVNKLSPYGTVNPSSVAPYTPFFSSQQIAAAGTGSNYIANALRNGHIDDQNLSVSGGSANTKVFTSFNYFDQQGLLRNSNFQRYAGRINIDQRIGSSVTFSIGVSYSQVNNDNVPVGNSSDPNSPSLIQTALQFPSSIPLYTTQGELSSAYYARTPNPESYFMITDQTFTKRLLVTPNLKFNIFDGFQFHLTGGIDNNSSENQFFIPVAANFSTVPEGDAQDRFSKVNNYSAEGYFTFDHKIGKGQFSAVAGVGYYQSNDYGFGLDAVGFSTDAFGVNNIGIASDKTAGNVSSYRDARTKLSQFTRLNYTFDDKYILQFTGRFDGTSNFPTAHQFGFFPGLSGGWILSQEKFLKDVKWLNQLKLRGGYGTSGNESITTANNYAYSLYALTTNYGYLIGNQYYNSGFIQTQLGNPDLKWETDIQADVALDFGIFNNRVNGSVDYFQRTAKNLLDFRVLPSQNAITTQAFNVGSTRSRGIEVTINLQNIVTKDFSWSTTATYATAKSFWLTRNPAVALASYIGYNDPIHSVYGWKTDGLIRTSSQIPSYQPGAFVGNIKYVDLNNDGKLDINDDTYLGNTDPKGTFGLSNTIKLKNFDLSFFIYGSYGYLAFDGYRQFASLYNLTNAGAPINAAIQTLNSYTSFNPNGRYPGFANDPAAANNPAGVNDFLTVKNAYFARLKSITLGYTLPKSLLSKQHVFNSLRFFIDVQNLFNVTNTTGIDPEMSRDNNPYPIATTTAFGINAQF